MVSREDVRRTWGGWGLHTDFSGATAPGTLAGKEHSPHPLTSAGRKQMWQPDSSSRKLLLETTSSWTPHPFLLEAGAPREAQRVCKNFPDLTSWPWPPGTTVSTFLLYECTPAPGPTSFSCSSQPLGLKNISPRVVPFPTTTARSLHGQNPTFSSLLLLFPVLLNSSCHSRVSMHDPNSPH